MYLTNLEELKAVTDRRLIASMARRLNVKDMNDYIDFCEWSVKDILVRRMNANRLFESKTHCIRYIALKVFKSCLKLYYTDKHNSTYAYEESFFTGEWDDAAGGVGAKMANPNDVITQKPLDYDDAIEFICKRLREEFPRGQSEPYIQHQFFNGARPKWREYKIQMDMVAKVAANDYIETRL